MVDTSILVMGDLCVRLKIGVGSEDSGCCWWMKNRTSDQNLEASQVRWPPDLLRFLIMLSIRVQPMHWGLCAYINNTPFQVLSQKGNHIFLAQALD